MSPVTKKLAAGATFAALGGLTAVAIGQPGRTDTKTQAAAPVEVRTETIRKTVHVVRHEKPRHKRVRRPAAPVVAPRPASAAPPPSPAPATTGSAPGYSAPAPRPVTPRYTASIPSTTHHPVTTRTSGGSSGGGSGSGEGEREREGREHDD
jgi:hypothetical protein